MFSVQTLHVKVFRRFFTREVGGGGGVGTEEEGENEKNRVQGMSLMQSRSAFKTDSTRRFFSLSLSLSHTHTHYRLTASSVLCSTLMCLVLLNSIFQTPLHLPPPPPPPPPPPQLPQQSNGLDKFSVSRLDGELVFVSLNVTKPMFQGELHIHCVGTKLKVLGHHHPQ